MDQIGSRTRILILIILFSFPLLLFLPPIFLSSSPSSLSSSTFFPRSGIRSSLPLCTLQQWAYLGGWRYNGRSENATTWREIYAAAPTLESFAVPEQAPHRFGTCVPIQSEPIPENLEGGETGLIESDRQAHQWEYLPLPSLCQLLRPSREDLIASFVHSGAWLVVGDSLSGYHSDTLYWYLKDSTTYFRNPSLPYEHTHRLLSPSHSLFPTLLQQPDDRKEFRPLFTKIFSRYLLSRSEMKEFFPKELEFKEHVWEDMFTPSLEEILKDFAKKGRMNRVLVLNTGAWWARVMGGGIESSEQLMLQVWIGAVGKVLDLVAKYVRDDKVVYIRTTAAGHEDCKSATSPLSTLGSPHSPLPPPKGAGRAGQHSWSTFPLLNSAWYSQLDRVRSETGKAKNVYILDVWPGTSQRPDAHCSEQDCLHWIVGVGVYESWTDAIWTHLASLEEE